MEYTDFQRVILHPHWCLGDPLVWQAVGADGRRAGIADFALEGKVGKFNLCWWVLEHTTPPRLVQTYRNAPLQWAIMIAPTLRWHGKTLEHWAAILTLAQFNEMMTNMLKRISTEDQAKLATGGMTLDRLWRLANRPVNV